MRGLTVLSLVLALTTTSNAAQTGEQIFASECAACHQPDGAGAVGLAPPLRDTLKAYVASPEGRGYLAQILISGMAGPIRSQAQYWNGVMPSFSQHSDADLAATLSYVLMQFNGLAKAEAAQIAPQQIAEARKRAPAPGDTRKLRQQLSQQPNPQLSTGTH